MASINPWDTVLAWLITMALSSNILAFTRQDVMADVFGSACSACTKATVKVEHLKELAKQSTEQLNF